MKTLIYVLPLMLGLILFSCGDSADADEEDPAKMDLKTEMCGCAEMNLEMYKKMKETGDDVAKLKEIEETYKDDMEACQRVGKDYARTIEGMSEEEQEAREKEEIENCDAMQEIQKIMTGM
jgi:hypothetical protein